MDNAKFTDLPQVSEVGDNDLFAISKKSGSTYTSSSVPYSAFKSTGGTSADSNTVFTATSFVTENNEETLNIDKKLVKYAKTAGLTNLITYDGSNYTTAGLYSRSFVSTTETNIGTAAGTSLLPGGTSSVSATKTTTLT